MGRRASNPNAIPRLRLRKRGDTTYYFYDHGGSPRKEEALGTDYGLAIRRWAEIERDGAEKPQEVITFKYVSDRYLGAVVPTKAPGTQRDNHKSMRQLLAFFNEPPCPLDSITPNQVKKFLRWRGTKAQVRANRDKALLSHLWNWAREEGYTDMSNPCAGIRGFKETGRDVYIEDDVFNAVYNLGDQALRDAMDLAYLTGQRVADTRTMDQRDVREGFLHVKQGKTKAKRRIEIVGDLAALLARIATRKTGYKVHSTRLIVSDQGRPLSEWMLRDRFNTARDDAGIPAGEFQFRDLRAKAGTDKTDSTDIRQAQQQLGHTTVTMTEHYVRNRRGDKVTPTK
jgi:integrase